MLCLIRIAAHELSRAKASGETSLTLSISPRTVPKKVLAKMASEALADRRGLENMYVPMLPRMIVALAAARELRPARR